MRPSTHVSASFETSLEEVLEADSLDRVLVFTTVKLLGLLTVAKRGSVDGTSTKSMAGAAWLKEKSNVTSWSRYI